MNTVGENIALLRKQKNLTQEAFASEIGVSAQAVSKWENNTNMPDIMLLPIIADIFDVTVDMLFGRNEQKTRNNFETAFDFCCDSLLENMIASCTDDMYHNEFFENAFEHSKELHKNDTRSRSAIIKNHGVLYYRNEIGGLLLRKPKGNWYDLFSDESAKDTLTLLSNRDFCVAMAEIIRSQKTSFTLPSLCNRCNIENITELEETLKSSNLFNSEKFDIDGTEVTVYKLFGSHKLFVLFAIMLYAKEYSKFEDIYTSTCIDDRFCYS